MDRTATPNRRMVSVEQAFERSRLSEEILASAYERLVPVVRRTGSGIGNRGAEPSTCSKV